jgi:hypothetical protein
MVITVGTILLIVAVVCFVLAAVGFKVARLDLISIGLAAFAGSFLVGAL